MRKEPPRQVVMSGNKYMRVANGRVHWDSTAEQANTYDSKYAAKVHLNTLRIREATIRPLELDLNDGTLK